MNAVQYKALRETLGTQLEVAELLGIARETVARRELETLPITTEAELALRYLAKKPRKAKAGK